MANENSGIRNRITLYKTAFHRQRNRSTRIETDNKINTRTVIAHPMNKP